MANQSVKHHYFKQYFATFVVNVYMFGFGVFEYWYSNNDARDYVLPLGGIIGSIFFGLITNRFGRKVPLLLIAISMTVTYLLTLCIRYEVYFTLMAGGVFGGGVYVVAPLYLSEISEDCFRGAMSTTLTLSQIFGQMLLMVVPYRFLHHHVFVQVFFVLISILFAILLHMLPDTPVALLKRAEIVKAEKSIRFYKNISKTDEHMMESLQRELHKVKDTVAANNEVSNESRIVWSNFTTRTARKALTIGAILVTLSGCSTFNTVHQYALRKGFYEFQRDSLFYAEKAIVIALIGGVLLATQLVDNVGRKILIIISAIGTSSGLTLMCVYGMTIAHIHTSNTLKFIPLISVIMVSFFSSLGIQSLTMTIISEIMPENIKNYAVSLCGALYWTSSIFVSMSTIFFGYHCVMLGSAMICVAGATCIGFIMPETRRKSHQEILKLL